MRGGRLARRCLSGNIRQHVNPLSRKHQQPIELSPQWIAEEYECPSKPFVIDIGCCKGRWAAEYARSNPDKNILGIDIRKPVIELALERKKSYNIGNLHFLKSNANVDISSILCSINETSSAGVALLAVQFPDPYFKLRQQKRRLINDQFMESLSNGMLATGTILFIQTDVEELMIAMIEVLKRNSHVVSLVEGQSYINTLHNPSPFDIPTEREVSCREVGNNNIYRVMVKTLR